MHESWREVGPSREPQKARAAEEGVSGAGSGKCEIDSSAGHGNSNGAHCKRTEIAKLWANFKFARQLLRGENQHKHEFGDPLTRKGNDVQSKGAGVAETSPTQRPRQLARQIRFHSFRFDSFVSCAVL